MEKEDEIDKIALFIREEAKRRGISVGDYLKLVNDDYDRRNSVRSKSERGSDEKEPECERGLH
ncbi:MAG: hypothetical protein WCW13_07360 [archaeon]